MIWHGNQGIYIYDETGKPQKLKSDHIKPLLDSIPNQMRTRTVGVYHADEDQYLLFICDPRFGSNMNLGCLRFDFRTAGWTYDGPFPYPVNSAISYGAGDESPATILGHGYNDVINAQLYGDTVQYGYNHIDGAYSGAYHRDIDWHVKFKPDSGFEGHIAIDKHWAGVELHLTSMETISLDVYIDDAIGTGIPTKTISIAPSGDTAWDDGTVWDDGSVWGAPTTGAKFWALGLKGKRCQLKLSGSSHMGGLEIFGYTLFYEPLDRMD